MIDLDFFFAFLKQLAVSLNSHRDKGKIPLPLSLLILHREGVRGSESSMHSIYLHNYFSLFNEAGSNCIE
jgi:hypothetical protein